MSILDTFSAAVGRTVGSMTRAFKEARGSDRKRPRLISAWSESARWRFDTGEDEFEQQRAMRSGWVYDAINMIAGEISASEAEIVKNNPGQKPIAVSNHPLDYVLRRPNPFIGRSFLWRYTGWWLELDGNAYWFVIPDPDGGIAEIWPLPANMVEPYMGEEESDGFISFYRFTANGRFWDIPTEYICHLKLPNPFDIFRGLAPLSAAMLAVDGDMAMARWNANFFSRDNVMPSAVINLASGSPDTDIDDADYAAIKEELETEYAAFRRKTLVTRAPGGVDVNLLGWSSKEMDFLAGRQFSKEEIYNIYGVPPGLKDKNATEANAQTADRTVKEKTIWPLLVLIAEQITAQIVVVWYSEDYELRFKDVRPTNRALELQELNAARGALTVDEVRVRFYDAPPLQDKRGNELFGAPSAPALPDFGIQVPEQQQEPEKPTEPARDTLDQNGDTDIEPPAKSITFDSVMIALFVPMRTAPILAIDGETLPAGSTPIHFADLHLTLVYLGATALNALRRDELVAVVQHFAATQAPICGKIGGIGIFQDTGDDNALYASFDAIGLAEFRTNLVQQLSLAGLLTSQVHDFTPHITLAYLPSDIDFIPALDPSGLGVDFNFITLSWGGERYSFALTGAVPTEVVVNEAEAEIEEPAKFAAYELELRRWREKAVKALKAGKPMPTTFKSDILPPFVMDAVIESLAIIETADDIKALFSDAMNLCKQTHRDDDQFGTLTANLEAAIAVLADVKPG